MAAGFIKLHHLPTPLRVYIFNDIDLRRSLFGLAPLCELGCAIHFSNSTATVTYSGKTVLSGKRLPPDLLWAFDLPVIQHITRSSTTFANAAMSISSDAAFVNFAHATLGSPSLSTLLRALKAGYLDSFPRLSAALVTAHPPHTLATAKGHLDQHRQGLDSTMTPHIHLTPPLNPTMPPTMSRTLYTSRQY